MDRKAPFHLKTLSDQNFWKNVLIGSQTSTRRISWYKPLFSILDERLKIEKKLKLFLKKSHSRLNSSQNEFFWEKFSKISDFQAFIQNRNKRFVPWNPARWKAWEPIKTFFKNFGPKVFWGEMGLLGPFFSKVCLVGATHSDRCVRPKMDWPCPKLLKNSRIMLDRKSVV